jgi:hypothetical protein
VEQLSMRKWIIWKENEIYEKNKMGRVRSKWKK